MNSPKLDYSPTREFDIDVFEKIINSFKSGNDQKAIDLWRTASYAKLPIQNFENFYVLALKLKDMQILDFENTERVNKSKDREIAQENEKLKEEIHNLAKAIDSVRQDNESRKYKSQKDKSESEPHDSIMWRVE